MDLELRIDGQRADLDDKVSIPLTKQFEDMTNPTAIRNDLSKTITLPATQTNNAIFGQMWRMDQVNASYTFNPDKRVPYILLQNGALLSAGYIKLNKITRADALVQSYSVTFFGGLGDFFYALSEKDVRDVDMPNGLAHTINAAAVRASSQPIVNGLLYFLSYQGKYDAFESGKQYTRNPDTGQYEIMDLPQEVDEHQRNEFRSYYQRPAISMQMLLSRIFEQSGFDVKVSDVFKGLPYWTDLYLALSMPEKNGTDITYNGLVGANVTTGYYTAIKQLLGDDYNIAQHNDQVVGSDRATNVQFVNSNSAIFDLTRPATGDINLNSLGKRITISFEIGMKFVGTVNNRPVGFKGRLYTSGQKFRYGVRFYNADNATQLLGDFTQEIENGGLFMDSTMVVTSGVTGGMCYNDGDYGWTLSGSLSIPASVRRVKAVVYHNAGNAYNYTDNTFRWQDRDNALRYYTGGITMGLAANSNVKVTDTINVRSNGEVRYDAIMPSGTNQSDFVRSFFKAFGMIWQRDPIAGTVTLKTRNEFFAGYQIVDWTNKIDHSKTIEITPLNYDYRYGLFAWQKTNSYRAQQYADLNGIEYGAMRIDTGYEFDNTKKEFLDGNKFRNAILSMEYDNAFNGRNAETARDDKILPAIFELKNGIRESVSETFQLFFKGGIVQTTKEFRLTDDVALMTSEGAYCWNNVGGTAQREYLQMLRQKTFNGNVYSLDFSKPGQLYYPSNNADYPEESTIYRRFWRAYMAERHNSNTRKMSLYVWLTEPEFAMWEFNTFVKIDNTLWHVNKISDFDATKYQSTKAELIRVNDIAAYISGQNMDVPAYYKTANGGTYYFSPADTPFANFATNATSLTINGVAVLKSDIAEINFGSLYDNIVPATMPNNFLYNFANLKRLVLPNCIRVTSIGSYCIANCPLLEEIIGLNTCKSVQTIGGAVLNGLTSISLLDLSGFVSVVSFGNSFLRNNSSLSQVDFSAMINLTTVGTQTATGCAAATLLDLSSFGSVPNVDIIMDGEARLLRSIVVGDVDWTNKTVNPTYGLRFTANTSDCKIYADTFELGQIFKDKFGTRLSNWTIVVGRQ